ncbi:hypothetical protein LA03_04205 [Burkholderia gladioli]|uniref:hypothetical protein n=1 Tax=Burkholderia gladioli TaxID=28095 RepID=UPI00051064D7|nr:hypothetical protein [Burkholderia gladioli]KGE11461.1 hypothetical protein LA03_04205 [Burkholderia gladioli]
MDISKKIEQLELNVAAIYDMLAGASFVTSHLVENILTPKQKAEFIEWLAHQSSESQEAGRGYLAQVGSALTREARFVELMHLAQREFVDQKQAALAAGKPIL